LLKEKSPAHVTIMAPDVEGVDDILFTAAAKGADRMIKILGDFEEGVTNHALARVYANILPDLNPDLILTGVQAHEDLDGSIGPLLAAYLEMPYIGYVAGVSIENGNVLAMKEYPGGLNAEMLASLPVVLGIQVAEEPPRYVAVSKVRQAMKSTEIEEIEAPELDSSGSTLVDRMYIPEVGEGATILEGDVEEVSDNLIEIFKEMGVL
jgi:electron transfer flavoprotein beta subunit